MFVVLFFFFLETIVNKLHIQKVSGFSIAQGPAPYIVGVYVPGTKVNSLLPMMHLHLYSTVC